MRTNIMGTFTLLEAARAYYAGLTRARSADANFRFHHVSTDEVFGALEENDPPFNEHTPYDPRSPYSSSKAASDHLVRAWHHTYGLPSFVSNTTNNYGIWQFPEKLIPLVLLNALEGKPLPVYGDGSNKRDWLFVEDHAVALVKVLLQGKPGDTYCIGARQPRSNLEVVHAICAELDRRLPDPEGPRSRLIRFVTDRPGHDFRYEIDPSTRRGRASTGRPSMISNAASPDHRLVPEHIGPGGRRSAPPAIRASGSVPPPDRGRSRPSSRLTPTDGRTRSIMKGILLAGGSGTRLHPIDPRGLQAAAAGL